MKPIFYYDGRLYNAEEAAIPFTDRSLYFGDAIYDACLVKDGQPYLLDAHLDRFARGCGALRMRLPMPRRELSALLCELCKQAAYETEFLYFQASRGAVQRRHFASEEDSSHLLVRVSEMLLPDPGQTLSLILTRDSRYDFCHIKTTNLLPAVLASTKAMRMGADEAVFVRDGIVTECAHSNVSILKNGTLITHPKGRRILPGIGREQLLAVCAGLHIPVKERAFSVRELYEADEILITSTSKLCLRANRIFGQSVGMKDKKNAEKIIINIFENFRNGNIAQ